MELSSRGCLSDDAIFMLDDKGKLSLTVFEHKNNIFVDVDVPIRSPGVWDMYKKILLSMKRELVTYESRRTNTKDERLESEVNDEIIKQVDSLVDDIVSFECKVTTARKMIRERLENEQFNWD